ncbi:MAG TPA: pantoate--beta-alanine ligase [Candidatus Cloacimonadota bacterium]|nr:pantoate--beta-alanine ligase [Candidatus Cloacimonadota bacterium]
MKPTAIYSIPEMRKVVRSSKGTIGFVPTMGFLHDGHLSLVKEARKKADVVVVSIFVNPTQFSPNEDLQSYPRDAEKDLAALARVGADYVFFPTNEMMYPADYKTWVTVDELTSVLCGKTRTIHFRGVTTVVTKLMHIIDPDFMFMGEKDFQQLKVLQQMGRDLNFRTEIIGCPLIREKDGLAMSSRNVYLSADEREKALCLNRSLRLAQQLFAEGSEETKNIVSQMQDLIEAAGGKIDYIEIVDPETLQSIPVAHADSKVMLAVYMGKTRLIDNMCISK